MPRTVKDMKIEKLKGYEPEYPRKKSAAVKLGAIAAAAVLAAGTFAGCRPDKPELAGAPVVDTTPTATAEPVIEGELAADPTVLEGEPAVDETECGSNDTEPGGDNEGEAGDIFGDAGITGLVLADPGTVDGD